MILNVITFQKVPLGLQWRQQLDFSYSRSDLQHPKKKFFLLEILMGPKSAPEPSERLC